MDLVVPCLSYRTLSWEEMYSLLSKLNFQQSYHLGPFCFPLCRLTPSIKSLQSLKFCSLWFLTNGTSLLYFSLCIKYNLWDPLFAYIAISRSVNFNLLAYCLVTNYSQTQGCSQDHIKRVLNSADPCSVQTQIHYLAKHLATKNNVHHPDMIIHIIL